MTKFTVMIVINLDILSSVARTPPLEHPERLWKWPKQKRILPKNIFPAEMSIFWQKISQTVTSFKTLGLGVKAQQVYLRWVCWTFKSDLSSTTKCDQIHSNDHYKLGHSQLDGSYPTSGTARKALKMAQKERILPKNLFLWTSIFLTKISNS